MGGSLDVFETEMMDYDDEGSPGLPGGKFYMTPDGRDRLEAESEAVR